MWVFLTLAYLWVFSYLSPRVGSCMVMSHSTRHVGACAPVRTVPYGSRHHHTSPHMSGRVGGCVFPPTFPHTHPHFPTFPHNTRHVGQCGNHPTCTYIHPHAPTSTHITAHFTTRECLCDTHVRVDWAAHDWAAHVGVVTGFSSYLWWGR